MCYNASMKILSPAGNMNSLKLAVYNGADEVYVGINDFNARNNIDGFTMESLKDAVDFCHIYNVKINLAINILFKNKELPQALEIIKKAYQMGVDYFIIQDLGLAVLVKRFIKNAKIHASTQMGIHNLEGVRFLEKIGFSRVVLARETSISEIKRIKENSNVEIEYFVHGALCVCFSGNCYLSEVLFDASGNRGKCKQLCRLNYSFNKNDKTLLEGPLLSAKDFNMLDRLNALKEAGVDVLKIEGRARRPFYIASATKAYKNALNGIKTEQETLPLAFNRGFTPGYLDGNGKIISKSQNHIGIEIGTIKKVVGGKTFNEVFFNSNYALSPKSTFKTFDKNGEKSVFTAYDLKKLQGNEYRLTTTAKVNINDKINLIVDNKKEEEALKQKFKMPLAIDIYAEENKNLKGQVKVDETLIEVIGDTCESAKSSPLSIRDFEQSFEKNEYFLPNINLKILENIFLTKKSLNEFRRQLYSKVIDAKVNKHKKIIDDFSFNIEELKAKPLTDFCYTSKIQDNYTSKNVIYSPDTYSKEDVVKFKNSCIQSGKTPILDLVNYAEEKDIQLIQNIITQCDITFVANNYFALSLKGNYIIGPYLNVYNNVSANTLNVPFICFNTANKSAKDTSFKPIYYMTLRHCPYKNLLDADCKNCPHANDYYYKMQDGKKLYLKRKKLSSCTFYLTD